MSKKHEAVLIYSKKFFLSRALSVCLLRFWMLGYRHSIKHKAIYGQHERLP